MYVTKTKSPNNEITNGGRGYLTFPTLYFVRQKIN